MTFYIDIHPEWYHLIQHEFQKPYFYSLWEKIKYDRSFTNVYPLEKDVFNALKHTPFSKVKVVILGQDPYHGPGQAHGLCFSVPEGVQLPPSLKNIFKEISSDLQLPYPNHGNLTKWALQGVLLLNTTLTVPEKKPMAHARLGWEQFTDEIIKLLASRNDPVIFALWGSHAQSKVTHIVEGNNSKHVILKAPHPSPLSAHRGFLGCGHFSTINEILIKLGKDPIDWKI